MRALSRALIFVTFAALACGSRPYNWAPIKLALGELLPVGTPQTRVSSVLDSLGFLHGQVDPRDSTITASKQEPHASKRLVFSTLRVVLKFNGDGHLMQQNAQEVFTGP